MKLDELLKEQEKQRNIFTNKVIDSSSCKKVIVSGPGTGKTYLFDEILKKKKDRCLVLTFINNLVCKLEEDLKGRAVCCTFHSFSKSLLHKIKRKGLNDDFVFYPNLKLIIESDARMLLGERLSFEHCFRRLGHSSKELRFFIEHSNYYNAVSFDDSVYRVIEHFKENPEQIPEYEQILVDEYQDFNLLEVVFIDMLGTKSPLVIVGDDDQALYAQLKDASARYIRMKYIDNQYEHFELPFCSRCTKVIVDAIEDVISIAKSMNKLTDRIDKKYICFLPTKLEDSRKYPEIIHAHCSVQSDKAPYMAWFIKQEINKLTPKEVEEANKKGDYTVLITGPYHYLDQINSCLSTEEKWSIEYKKTEPPPKKTTILDGYRVLLNNDRFSNFGWRIIIENSFLKNQKEVLREAVAEKKRLYDCLTKTVVKKHERILELLRQVKTSSCIDKREEKKLKSIFGKDIDDLRPCLQDYVKEERVKREDKDFNRMSVILTTYVGCKGISAGYVFAVGLNEGILPRQNKNPNDMEICQFIVILSRTIKKCHLLSVSYFGGNPAGFPSVFINWIDQKLIRKEKVDKEYWSSK